MLSRFHEGAPPDIPDKFSLPAYVLGAGADDAIALEVIGGASEDHWTYAQLRAAVYGAASGLARHGIAPGDHVLMRLGNSADFPICYLAAMAAGAVPIVTSPQLTEAEVATVARQVAPVLSIEAPRLAGAPAHIPRLSVEALRGFYALPAAAPHVGDANRPGYIVFTSGTSGQPRAVVHAHRAILARRMMIRDWYDLRPTDRLCHAGAFNWTFTLGTGLMDPWSLGATALILAPGAEASALPGLLARHGATILAAAPGILRRMLRDADWPGVPSLRHGLTAGEKLPETLRARWTQNTGTALYEAFGMSECSTFISGAPGRPAAPGALGGPQRGRHIALIRGGAPVPIGDEGDIAIHHSDPGLMLGYHGAPDETSARFEGPWFLTGDKGVMDAGGQITYLGRADDMMNAGGVRVSPLEVEQAMALHPAITDCAAVELRVSPETSIIALAYTGAAVPSADLAAFAAKALARYKQPRAFYHMPALPRGANNKLLRRSVRSTLESQAP